MGKSDQDSEADKLGHWRKWRLLRSRAEDCMVVQVVHVVRFLVKCQSLHVGAYGSPYYGTLHAMVSIVSVPRGTS